MQRRFRIGFVSPWNSDDVKAWSGTPFFMRRAIEERGHEVIPIGPLQAPNHFAHTALRKTCRLMGRHYDMQRHPWVAKAYARQVSERVRGQAIDILISTSTIPLADLKADVPVMVWTDAVFSAMVDFYPGNWSRLWSVSRRQGEALETRAIRRIDFNIFSSQWAASCAVKLHGADPAKLAVIPLGANLEAVPGDEEVAAAVLSRNMDECRLLFVGVDWARKGGPLVVETAHRLRARGINVSVDVVGCLPPDPQPDFVRLHGFVSKACESGAQQLRSLFLASHFLFVPSLAECYGLVYAEASAHGLPALARDVGGVASVVMNDRNGYLLPFAAGADDYADVVEKALRTPGRYASLAVDARREFEQNLNWSVAARRFESCAADLIGAVAT